MEKSTMNREELMEKLKNISEYGMYTGSLAGKIEEVVSRAEKKQLKINVAGALNNFDHSHKLLPLLKKDIKDIVKGLELVGNLVNAEKYLLYVPEGEEDFAKAAVQAAKEEGVLLEIIYGMVNTRKEQGLLLHMESLRKIYILSEGKKEEDMPLCIEYITSKESKEIVSMRRVKANSTFSDLLDLPKENIKAVKIAGRLYRPKILDQALEERVTFGDGVIRIYDKSCCIVDSVEKDIHREREESCGKCTFCREGLYQFDLRLEEIKSKKGDTKALEVMKRIGRAMTFNTLCSVGQFSSFELLDSLELFADEYEEHIKKKNCPAGVCKAFTSMYIDPRKCKGCGECLKVCGEDCIEGFTGYIHMIEDDYCSKCDACSSVCPEKAIYKVKEKLPKLPDRLTRVGFFKRF